MEGDGAVGRVVELDGPAVERLRGACVVPGQRRLEQLQLLLADLPHLAEDAPDDALGAGRHGEGARVPEVAAGALLQRAQVDEGDALVRLLLAEAAPVLGHLAQLPLQLVVEGVRGAQLVEDPDDGQRAVGAPVDQVQLQREPLAVDGVVGRRVPVHLLEAVRLAVHHYRPDLALERHLQSYVRAHVCMLSFIGSSEPICASVHVHACICTYIYRYRDVVAVVDERGGGGGVGAVEGVEVGVGDGLLGDDVDRGLLLPLPAQLVRGAQLAPVLRPVGAPRRVPVRRPTAICRSYVHATMRACMPVLASSYPTPGCWQRAVMRIHCR
jgi:hypothetical protein